MHYFYKCTLLALIFCVGCQESDISTTDSAQKQGPVKRRVINPTKKGKKKTPEERQLFTEARQLHEYYMQVNPETGQIPLEAKQEEQRQSRAAKVRPSSNNAKTPGSASIVSRGPSNLGGRTRSLAYDLSDATGNTILAGGVSGGVFRTTDGGASWNKVSSPNEIHNVTAIAQDPRPGFQNIWYYGTGELSGNSASGAGSFYLGDGIWQSTDGGLNWTEIANSSIVPVPTLESFDSRFDIIHRLVVHPTTGHLYAACVGALMRYDGANWTSEIEDGTIGGNELGDIVIASTGRAYTAFSGNCDAATRGVWTSATGIGGWTRIATNGTPAAWAASTGGGRTVLALAPSNENILYALYANGNNSSCPAEAIEADLWRWNQGTTSWTDLSARMPNEAGCSVGNDPFAIQGGYDMCVSVKPDNQNFVVIGGTNAYRSTNVNSSNFTRIGGYETSGGYALYDLGSGVEHHPDVHILVFNPNAPDVLLSGTDGGVHRTSNINAGTVGWENLNNNYQTYQYYYVAIDPQAGSDIVIGGAQDNGTTGGGTALGFGDITTHGDLFGGDGVAVAVSRDNACTPFFFGSQNGNLVRDCPTGAFITPNGSNSEFVTYFHLDPDNNNILYYAGQFELYRTTNSTTVASNTWTNLGDIRTIPGAGGDFISSFATTWGAYTAASNLFIGTDEGHIFRLTNPAGVGNLASAVDITPPGATTGFPSTVKSIAIHPNNPDIVMAVYTNYNVPSIWLTNNATAATPTWTLVEQNLSAPSIRSAAIAEVGGQTYYFVGTAVGLYSNDDPANNNWVREGGATLGFALISDLRLRPADNMLLIGTHGNGMFQSDLNSLIVLPIDWVDFRGEQIENYVGLNWTVEQDESNKLFEVERSLDATSFEKIGELNVSSRIGTENYSFRDEELLKEVQYYRIKQVDVDGAFSYSSVIAVAVEPEIRDAWKVDIYPNPVQDVLNVKLANLPSQSIQLKLYNQKGELILEENKGKNSKSLELNLGQYDLASGIYVLQVWQGDILMTTQKIQKTR